MDKFKTFFKENKKSLYFIFSIALVGLVSGICFYYLISYNDKTKCIEYINKYLTYIKNKNYLKLFLKSFIFNTITLTIPFICALSITGFFTSTLIYFAKNFITGLYLTLLLKTTNYYSASLAYFLPTGIISIFILSIMLLFSLSISTNLIYSLFKGKNINFKKINKKYLFLYLISLLINIILNLYDTFILPKILLNFI